MNHHSFPISFICILFLVGGALGFTPPPRTNIIISTSTTQTDDVLDISSFCRQSKLYSYSSPSDSDPQELIARRIVVTGDVSGGYYRSCVKNEGSRFRKLVGTMTPPEENSQRAEIYVEGKRKMVEGFIRWCERGDVGLSQTSKVDSVSEEEPTGLFDDFYVETGRDL